MLATNMEDILHSSAHSRTWFVFVCQNNCVPLAQNWFESWTKCECYYPISKSYVYPKHSRTDAPTVIERPALGGYLFTRFYETVHWHFIREQNSHVLRWLRVFNPEDEAYHPAAISDREILILRRMEARGDFDGCSPDQKDKMLSKTLRGQVVHIPYGPFVGTQGAVLDSVWRKICKIKITVLGKDVLITFPFSDIFPEWETRNDAGYL